MKGDIGKSVRRAVARQLEMNVDDVEMDSDLIELGADSLDIIEIIDDIEDEFDIYIMDYEKIKTVGDIVEGVKRECA